jgi:hypothetical protein
MTPVGGKSRRIPGASVIETNAPAAKGANEVLYGTARVLVKPNHFATAMVANEFICARLAIGLGLPVPMGDAATLNDQSAWVSAEIVLDGVALPDVDPDVIATAAPSDVAGICVFDVWVANYDRSPDNVLYHPKIGLWAIDHEHALGGPSPSLGDLNHEVLNPVHWPLLAPDKLNTVYLRSWCELVRQISPGMIDAALREAQARKLINTVTRVALQRFLSERSRMIDHLLEKSIGEEHVPWLTDKPTGT